MVVKHFPAGTKVVQPRLAIFCKCKTVFRTFAIAGKKKLAFLTLTWQSIVFVGSEFQLTFRIHHRSKRFVIDISEFVFRKNKVVARIHIAIELHHTCMSAMFGQRTHTGLNAHPVGKCRVEHLNVEFPHIFFDPLVEKCAQKFSPLYRFHREVSQFGNFVRR